MKNLIYLCKRSDQTLFRQTLPRFFPVQCCLAPLRQHCIRFFQFNFAPGVLRQYCTRFFSRNVVWSLSHKISQSFDRYNFVSRVLIQNCAGSFLMHCCLGPLGQYRIGFDRIKSAVEKCQLDFHKMAINYIYYRDYSLFSNDKFRVEL